MHRNRPALIARFPVVPWLESKITGRGLGTLLREKTTQIKLEPPET
ncbi:MAG: hypothetical protein J4G05_02340 [Chlorobi bacterium]|nr:hypothetical protein [Chlorobiota bacterium]